MYPNLLRVQLAMMLVASTGSVLLGRSLNDYQIVLVGVLGPLAAFLLVDRLRLVELSGWFANLVTIGVLIFTMWNFPGGGSTVKLVAVANLLAYLLTVLMFQAKTPRLCWQIMVLSTLQIIVAGIFNLNLEDGFLFAIYFVIAMYAWIVQRDFYLWTRTGRENRRQKARLRADSRQSDISGTFRPAIPVVLAPVNQSARSTSSAFRSTLAWLAVSLVFAFLLFHSLPHSRSNDTEIRPRQFTGTGKSWDGEFDSGGVVRQSGALQFRARFFDLEDDERVVLNGQPYFRGMAMSQIKRSAGRTGWEATYDHVFDFASYRRLPRLTRLLKSQTDLRLIGQEVVLEATADPLLYTMTPYFQKSGEEMVGEFCRDLSALTRRRLKSTDDLTSFRYRLVVAVDEGNRPLRGWPYVAKLRNGGWKLPMEPDSPEHELLTEVDRQHYPELLATADAIAERYPDSRLELCEAMVRHFDESNGFSYTLDYRDVPRDPELDPVEDFAATHRQGHCALYASALALMLRSQDIPARYVVGYHGGEFNSLTDSYVIHGYNAHAWVEAYLRPEDCTDLMRRQGVAGPGGAWITLDATPAVDPGNRSEALDLARSFWQDFVVSPDHNKQGFNETSALQFPSKADSILGNTFTTVTERIRNSRPIQIGLLALVGFYLVVQLLVSRRPVSAVSRKRGVGPIRRMLGGAARLVSRDLGDWIEGESTTRPKVPFYVRLEKLLRREYGLQRKPQQTHLEFAREASEIIGTVDGSHAANGIAPEVADHLNRVTEAFNRVRFGSGALDKEATSEIENRIQILEKMLQAYSKQT